MRRSLATLMAGVVASGSVFALSSPALATVTGLNGVIAAVDASGLILIDPVTGAHHTVMKNAYGAAWSPDGSRLAVEAYTGDPSHQVKVLDSDGRNVSILAGCRGSPTWSPDGRSIACRGDAGGDSMGIEVIDLNDSSMQLVAGGYEPDWSPDGNWIAHSTYSPDPNDWDVDLWLVHPDGSEPTQLTDVSRDAPGYGTVGGASWSPDGTTLAVTLYPDSNAPKQVGLVDADTGTITAVTDHASGIADPSWSPDGKKVVVTVGRNTLMTMSPGGTQLTPLKYSKGSNPAWQPASLTVRGSRSVVDAGSTLTLTMRLAWPGENSSIQLQSHRQGDAWKNVKALTVDSSGTVKAPVTIRTNTWFRTKWSGDSGHASATSAPTYVEARLVLTAGLKKSYDRKGRTYLYHAKQKVVFLAHLNPPKADDKVCFTTQYRKGASYRTFDVACYKTFDRGRLAGIMWTFQNSGNAYRIRATWEPTTQRPKDLDNLADTTKWSYFRITR